MNPILAKALATLEPAALEELKALGDKLPAGMGGLASVILDKADAAVRANNAEIFAAIDKTPADRIAQLENQVAAIVTATNLATNHAYVTALATPQID